MLVLSHVSLSIQAHELCCSQISRACLFADLSVTPHKAPPPSPSRSSRRVSSESTARSCGTRLISSVIKINEVLIAAVIYANDCGTQDEDFLSLLQSEGRSGICCVQEIPSQILCLQCCSCCCLIVEMLGGGGAVLMLVHPYSTGCDVCDL